MSTLVSALYEMFDITRPIYLQTTHRQIRPANL